MDVNERYIKLSGSFPTDRDLVMDQVVDLHVIADVVKVEDKSNQDGTVDRYYHAKVSELAIREDE